MRWPDGGACAVIWGKWVTPWLWNHDIVSFEPNSVQELWVPYNSSHTSLVIVINIHWVPVFLRLWYFQSVIWWGALYSLTIRSWWTVSQIRTRSVQQSPANLPTSLSRHIAHTPVIIRSPVATSSRVDSIQMGDRPRLQLVFLARPRLDEANVSSW